MKLMDNTERIIRPEMNVTVTRSKIELRSGSACVSNMDRSVFVLFSCMYYICMCGYIYIHIYLRKYLFFHEWLFG